MLSVQVPMCLAYLCAYVPTCLDYLYAQVSYMLPCSGANVSCVLTRSRANVSCVIACSRAKVLCALTCSSANVPCMFTYSRANASCMPCVPSSQRALHAHVQKVSIVFLQFNFFFCLVLYWNMKSLWNKVKARRVTSLTKGSTKTLSKLRFLKFI